MKIHAALLVQESINSYTTLGDARKKAFHREGAKFLRAIAQALNLPDDRFDVRSNKGGPAVSGEVTLHGESLYVQLSDSLGGPGVSVLFRSCKGRKDYTGGPNNHTGMKRLADESALELFIDQLRSISGTFEVNEACRTLSRYPDGTPIHELYDADDKFRTALNDAVPNFEYPDHSHKTVAQFLQYAMRVGQAHA